MWYPGEVKPIGDDKIKVLSMERIGRASDSFALSENEDLGWCFYYEILCVITPTVPETRRVFVLPREDLDKNYELMMQH